jgi:hypothetical protein
MGEVIAFGWYGGKYSHLDWLLPLLPKATHYCEPFGGSAAVLLNREPAPVETYNDIDSELVNFFRVLREQKDALIEAIGLTPFSREEFELAIAPPTQDISDLERARRFFVLLRSIFERVSSNLAKPIVTIPDIAERIEVVSRSVGNRSCVRVLLACSLAKLLHPQIDIRKPYTEIGDADVYAGRSYDEQYVSPFIMEHRLPCNPTTAFLTPAWRNRNITLAPDVNLVGRPPQVYKATLQLLTDVYEGRITAEELLAETIRQLLLVRDQQSLRRQSLLADLKSSKNTLALSSEDIITLIDRAAFKKSKY